MNVLIPLILVPLALASAAFFAQRKFAPTGLWHTLLGMLLRLLVAIATVFLVGALVVATTD